MCLAVPFDADGKMPKPLIAEEDIHVVKFLEMYRVSDGPPVYHSAYRSWLYELGVKQHSALTVYEVPENEYSYNGTEAKVSEGLHTFGDMNAVADMASRFGLVGRRSIFFKAIIPKGARYYVGSFEGTPNCYASDELLVTTEEVARNL